MLGVKVASENRRNFDDDVLKERTTFQLKPMWSDIKCSDSHRGPIKLVQPLIGGVHIGARALRNI